MPPLPDTLKSLGKSLGLRHTAAHLDDIVPLATKMGDRPARQACYVEP